MIISCGVTRRGDDVKCRDTASADAESARMTCGDQPESIIANASAGSAASATSNRRTWRYLAHGVRAAS